MKSTPIHQMLRQMQKLAPFHQQAYLNGQISSLPKRSVRRAELEFALRDLITRQLKRENRNAA